MKVAILGSGGIGLSTAAQLCREGHDPAVWSPSGRSTLALADGTPLAVTGAFDGEFDLRIAATCEEAMADARCVIICLPAYAHRAVMDTAAALAIPSQTMIVSSQYSLSALYLRKLLVKRGMDVPVIAWGTTVVLGRPSGASAVKVLSLRNRLDAATVPVSQSKAGLSLCQELFGDRFEPRRNVIAIQLSNVNPEVHLANALCSFTRIEKGESWDNYGHITPAVARLIDALDLERLAIAKAFDVEVRTIGEHMSLSFDLPALPLAEVARLVCERGGAPGPASLDARWMREDLAFGILPNIALAEVAGVEVPLHRAGFELFSTLLGRDLSADNDLLAGLEIGDHSVESLMLSATEPEECSS